MRLSLWQTDPVSPLGVVAIVYLLLILNSWHMRQHALLPFSFVIASVQQSSICLHLCLHAALGHPNLKIHTTVSGQTLNSFFCLPRHYHFQVLSHDLLKNCLFFIIVNSSEAVDTVQQCHPSWAFQNPWPVFLIPQSKAKVQTQAWCRKVPWMNLLQARITNMIQSLPFCFCCCCAEIVLCRCWCLAVG